MRQRAMSLRDLLSPVFAEANYAGDGAWVYTHCLYPDGQGVKVHIQRSSSSSWTVSDCGDGWGVLRDHFLNPTLRSAARRADYFIKSMGVRYEDGEWNIPNVSDEQLIGSILLVANAVQAWVAKMSSVEHHGRSEIIEEKLRENLKSAFDPKRVCFLPVIKGCNKAHTMSAMVELKDDRSAIFDVVTPFSASICPAFTKMSDIKNSESPPNFLGIVIENHQTWRSDDLALLRSVASDIIDINAGLPKALLSLAA